MSAILDWSQCPTIESDPQKRSGEWIFKGSRTSVATVFANLQDMSADEVAIEFGLPIEQIQSVLAFVADNVAGAPVR